LEISIFLNLFRISSFGFRISSSAGSAFIAPLWCKVRSGFGCGLAALRCIADRLVLLC
jgi:hypothetical protein